MGGQLHDINFTLPLKTRCVCETLNAPEMAIFEKCNLGI